jgi:hypothetical protein
MTLSHLRSTLLLANAKRYSLCSSVRISFTAACRALRPASFSLDISVVFCPGKPVAALRSLALTKGFLWASATNAASWAGLDTCHNPVPLHLPTCPSLRYFCSQALAVDFRTLYSSPAMLALNPLSSARAMTRSRIDLSWWAIMMRMKKEELELEANPVNMSAQGQPWCWQTPFTFFPNLGIAVPPVATRKGRVRWISLPVWGPANSIRFGVLLVAGSEKDNSLSLSGLLSLFGGWQAVRAYMCASLVSFRDFSFYFDHCSLWHTGPSV